MLAVHGGVGTKCIGVDKLCCDAVKKWKNNPIQAVVHLEADPLVNCGYGSSLTRSGTVEVEAGYMCSNLYSFGAVGAVSNTKYPILAAKYLADRFSKEQNFFLIPPQVVVGKGADDLIRDLGLPTCLNVELKSPNAVRQFERTSTQLGICHGDDVPMEEKMDTVGSVYIEESGQAEACVSSGGMIHKKEGRLGHSTTFGAGVWAEQRKSKSVAVSLSGCGEAITRCQLAQKLSEFLFDLPDDQMLPSAINGFVKSNFVDSPLIAHFPAFRRLIGGILIFRTGRIQELVAFHNSEKFAFAFWNGKGVKHYCSELEPGADLICNSFVAKFT